MKKVSTALGWILVLSGLCEVVHALQSQDFRDESASLHQIALDFKKKLEPASFEAQNHALSNRFANRLFNQLKGTFR